MAYSAEHYLELLQALLPTGLIWTREPDADLTKFLQALADEFARIDQRGDDLVNEADPRTTSELLPEWEDVLGLPDSCLTVAASTEERRQAVVMKYTSRGGQHPQYYIDLAERLGYEGVTVTEFRPFKAGDPAGSLCYGSDWAFAWRLNLPETAVTTFKAGASKAGDPLRSWGNERIECYIRNRAPAHTLCQFAYGSDDSQVVAGRARGAFSMAFSKDFDTVRGPEIPRRGAFSNAFSRDFDIKRRGAFSQAFSKDFDTLS